MSDIKTILLVCTGNSCRSVMAAGYLKSALEDKGEYTITSAGTSALHGALASSEVIEIMSEEDIDISDHLSQPVNVDLIDQADLILVMGMRHKEHILRLVPEAKDKVFLLTEYGRLQSEDRLVDPNIPDPVGRYIDYYRKVFAIIKESVMRTVKKLEEA